MSKPTESVPAGRLPIRVQRVLVGTGTVETSRTVDCPSRSRIDTDVCAHCWDSRGEETIGRRVSMLCAQIAPSMVRDLGYGAPLEDIMSGAVVCIRSDVPIDSIAAILRENAIEAVPVVDPQGRPVGIVTKTDLLRELQTGRDSATTAVEIMTKQVLWLPPEAAIASAAALMAAERIHHAIVLADDRRVIGIVSSLDLLGWLARKAGFILE